jgi:hypothetical protein
MATGVILYRRKTKFMIQFYKDLSYDALSTELRQVGPLPCATAAEAAIGNSEIIAAVNARHPKIRVCPPNINLCATQNRH